MKAILGIGVFVLGNFLIELPLLLAVVVVYRRLSKGAPMLTETARPGGIRT